MSTVTVCVPAFRSERFIQRTLASILAQTHTDLIVHLAIEPPAADVAAACGDLARDPRVCIFENDEVLGWDRNIRRLLSRVTTPFFIIVPHDDLLHPACVETLLTTLTCQPPAVVAYGDMFAFGALTFRKWIDLSVPLGDRLLDFFLAGAEAVPWRGVTRTAVLDGAEFPVDADDGLAVECEWALHLISRGPAVRVARPLYAKRMFPPGTPTASQFRLAGKSRERLLQALDAHRLRMLASVSALDLPAAVRSLVEAAAEAAMLRRHMTFSMGPLTPAQQARARSLVEAPPADDPRGRQIQSMALDVMSRHAAISGDASEALKVASAAVAAWPSNVEGLLHLAERLLAAGHRFEALDCAIRAASLAPYAPGVTGVLTACSAALDAGVGGMDA